MTESSTLIHDLPQVNVVHSNATPVQVLNNNITHNQNNTQHNGVNHNQTLNTNIQQTSTQQIQMPLQTQNANIHNQPSSHIQNQSNVPITSQSQTISSNSMLPSEFDNIVNTIESNIHSYNSKLPSRDIPRTTTHLMTDANTIPTHVPHANTNGNYIENDTTMNYIQDHNACNLKKLSLFEHVYDKIYFIVVCVLMYFIFCLPLVDTTLKKLSSKFFNIEGKITVPGIIAKSSIFGIILVLCNEGVNIFKS